MNTALTADLRPQNMSMEILSDQGHVTFNNKAKAKATGLDGFY